MGLCKQLSTEAASRKAGLSENRITALLSPARSPRTTAPLVLAPLVRFSRCSCVVLLCFRTKRTASCCGDQQKTLVGIANSVRAYGVRVSFFPFFFPFSFSAQLVSRADTEKWRTACSTALSFAARSSQTAGSRELISPKQIHLQRKKSPCILRGKLILMY